MGNKQFGHLRWTVQRARNLSVIERMTVLLFEAGKLMIEFNV